jgi:hypothetical protein
MYIYIKHNKITFRPLGLTKKKKKKKKKNVAGAQVGHQIGRRTQAFKSLLKKQNSFQPQNNCNSLQPNAMGIKGAKIEQ